MNALLKGKFPFCPGQCSKRSQMVKSLGVAFHTWPLLLRRVIWDELTGDPLQPWSAHFFICQMEALIVWFPASQGQEDKRRFLNPMSERWPRALAVGSQLCTRAESKQRLLYSGHSWHLPTCFISSIFQCLGTPHSLCLWLLEKIKHLFPFIETPNPFWYFLEANLLRITLCECFKIHGKMKSVVQVSLGAKKCFGDNFFS